MDEIKVSNPQVLERASVFGPRLSPPGSNRTFTLDDLGGDPQRNSSRDHFLAFAHTCVHTCGDRASCWMWGTVTYRFLTTIDMIWAIPQHEFMSASKLKPICPCPVSQDLSYGRVSSWHPQMRTHAPGCAWPFTPSPVMHHLPGLVS